MAKSRGRKLADIIVTSGADIAGTLSFDGGSTSADLSFADSDKATFGDALDLQIYHSGSDSLIVDSGTGGLYLRGSNFISLQNAAGSETMIYAGNDGAVQLKYDNSTKLATTSSGVSVTGSMVATTSVVDNVTAKTSSGNIAFKNNSGSEKMRLTHGGDLLVGKTTTSVTSIGFEARDSGILAVNRDSATPVYFGRQTDYGHIIEFRKDTSIVGKLGIESSGFYIDGEASHSGLKFTSAGITPRLNQVGSNNTINLGESGIRFKDLYLGGSVYAELIRHNDDTDTYIRWPGNNTLAFNTGASERMRIDASGDLIVGGTSSGANDAVSISNTGYIQAIINGDTAAYFNRRTSDGEIIRVQKDGSTVGTIGVNAARLYIHNNYGSGAGIRFDNASLRPSTAAGANEDATTDLGATGVRFKDLYLSGAANAAGFQSNQTTTGFGYINFGDTDDSNIGQIGYDHTDNYMRFQVNNTEKMRINSSGYLGIGTTSPASHLDVVGSMRLRTAAGYYIYNTSNQFRAAFHDNGSMTRIFADGDGSYAHMTFNGGNVGINTTAPDSKLTVYNDTTGITGLVKLWTSTANNTAADGGAIEWVGSADKTAVGAKIAATRVAAGAFMDLRFYTGRNTDSDHEKMRILTDGKVGIGTATPSTAKLVVQGADASDVLHLHGLTGTNTRGLKISLSNEGATNQVVNYDSMQANGIHVFKTAGTERMRIHDGGNVGIGTSSPSDALHVLDISGNAYISVARSTQSQGEVGLRLRGGTSGNDWYVYQKPSSNNLNFYNTADRVTIDSSGNVGIGTVSPTDELTIRGAQFNTTQISIGDNTDRLRLGYIHTDSLVSSTAAGQIVTTASTELKIAPASNAASKIMFFTNASSGAPVERMRITSTGNVGIGDSDPDSKLVVHGGRASEGVTAGGTYTELTRTSGGDLGLLFNKDTSKWLIGIDNSDGNAGPLRFMYGAYNASVHPGFGTDYSGLNLAYNGYVGIGTKTPSTPLQIIYNGGHTSGNVALANSAFDIYNNLEANTNEKGSILTFSDNYYSSGGNTYHRTIRAGIKGGTDNAGNTADGFLAFYTDAAGANSMPERMRIDHDGSTVINSTSPFLIGGTARLSIYDSSVILSAGLSGSDMFYIRKQGTAAFAWQTYNGNNGGQIQLQPYGGNVGIGTTSPAYKFEIQEASYSRLSLRQSTTGKRWQLGNDGSNLYIFDETASKRVIDFKSDGNVGIGTTNPDSKLTVNVSSNSDGIELQSNQTKIATLFRTSVGGQVLTSLDGVASRPIHVGGIVNEDVILANAGGNVGIGETIPTEKLHVGGNIKMQATTAIVTYQNAANTWNVGLDAADASFKFKDGTDERIRINDSGQVMVATTSPDTSASMGGQNPKLTVNGYTSLSGLRINGVDTGNTIYKTGGALTISIGDGNSINLKNTLGTARQSSGHWEVLGGKQLRAYRSGDSAYGSLYMDTGENLYIYNSWGAKSVVLDRTGNFCIGQSSQSGKLTVNNTGNNTGIYVLQTSSSVNQSPIAIKNSYVTGGQTGAMIRFIQTSGATVGLINSTINGTSYGESSDQRLKKNIVDAPSASNDIDSIQVRSFNWKVDDSYQKYGMIAQELETVAPIAVSEDADEMKYIDYSKLVPMLVKEIQSLRARVAELEGE